MRGASRMLARLLLVGVAAACVVGLAYFCLGKPLSGPQLERALREIVRQVSEASWRLRRSPQALASTAFVLGIFVGWLAAVRWLGSRIRRRPLIIADLRHADMSLEAGIRHVRCYASPVVADDAAAVWLILTEAAHGRLTLWRQASANTLWRIPSRQTRAYARRIAAGSAAPWRAETWKRFMLLGAEVEHLWPSRTGRMAPESSMAMMEVPSGRG